MMDRTVKNPHTFLFHTSLVHSVTLTLSSSHLLSVKKITSHISFPTTVSVLPPVLKRTMNGNHCLLLKEKEKQDNIAKRSLKKLTIVSPMCPSPPLVALLVVTFAGR